MRLTHWQPPPSSILRRFPDEIRLTAARDALVLTWGEDAPRPLGAETLRLNCRCAWSPPAAEGRFPEASPGIASPIWRGRRLCLNLHFSDGHARGVYPFSTLRALAAAPFAEQNP